MTTRKSAEKPSCPKSLKIGAQVYEIIELNPKDDALLTDGSSGYTQDARNVIVIDKFLHESKKKVTVWHEVLHATRFTFENTRPRKQAEYEEWEHHFIGIWENSLLMVLRDNPELTKWLLENTN